MLLNTLVKTVTTEVDSFKIFKPENLALTFKNLNQNVLADTRPLFRYSEDRGRHFDFEITFYTDHWTKNKLYSPTEAGEFFNKKSVIDTIRHELAHVMHMKEMEEKLVEISFERSPWAAPEDTLPLVGAYRSFMHGENSAHGKNWKWWARELGATPFAAHRTI